MDHALPCGQIAAPLRWNPPRFGWALLGLGVLLHFAPGVEIVLRAPVLGALVVVLGLHAAVASKRRFHRLGLRLAPGAEPTQLLSDGWFGVSRNPMYVGIAGVLLGVGLVLGSWPALLAAPVFLVIVRRWFVPVEECRLARAFGARWTAYAHQVPRWL